LASKRASASAISVFSAAKRAINASSSYETQYRHHVVR